MANFGVANSSTIVAIGIQNAMATTYKTLLAVAASTGNNGNAFSNPGSLARGKLYDLLIGTNGTPADNYMEFDVVRATIGTTVTKVGTVSSFSSAFMLDTADGGFGAFSMVNSSDETLIVAVAEPFYVGINQRASYRWVAAPGSEITYPANSSATGSNGLALRARSGGYTGTATGNWLICEQ